MRMNTVCLSVCLFVVMTLGSFASVYEGYIGKYKIVMLLDEQNLSQSVYHYWGRLLGIPLKRDASGRWCESAYAFDDEEVFNPSACFEGRFDGEFYHGRWYKTDRSRQYGFSLKKILIPKREDGYDAEEFYYDLLNKEITLRPTKKLSKRYELSVTSRIEPVSHLERSRVILKNKVAANRINKRLDILHREEVLQMIWCADQNVYISLKDMQEETGYDMSIEYYKKPFLLLSYSGSIACGGAHPNNYYDQYLFDLQSGEEIALRDLFTLYTKDKEGEEEIDPRFKTLLHKYREDEEDECYSEKESYYSFVLYPSSQKRIAVRLTEMGHAAFACELEPIARIPITEMKALALPTAYRYFPSLYTQKSMP